MELMTTPERIKYYRKLLKLSQKELAGDKISVSTIKLLEAGKRNLTVNAASILVNNFNTAAEERGILLNLSIKDLLVSELAYINELYAEHLLQLDSNEFDMDKYIEILDAASTYGFHDITIHAEIKIAEHLYQTSDYVSAIKHFYRAFDLCGKSHREEKIAWLMNKLGSCNYMISNYPFAKNYFLGSHREYVRNAINDIELEFDIYYNLAFCCIKMSQYNEALSYADKLFTFKSLDKKHIEQAIIVKAYVYSELGENEEALSLLNTLDTENLYEPHLLYHGMGIILGRLGHREESIQYLTRSIKIQLKLQTRGTTLSLKQMGEMYMSSGTFREAVIYLDSALTNASKFNQYDEIVDIYEMLYDLHDMANKTQAFEKYASGIFETIEYLYNNGKPTAKLSLVLFDFLLKAGEIESCKRLTKSLRDKLRQ